MKNILVIGAGRSASTLIHYLLDHAQSEDWRVRVCDASFETARLKVGSNPRGEAVQFDAEDRTLTDRYIEEADLVVSMLPPHMHVQIAKACIRKKAHLVTASYLSEEMEELDQEARENGLVFLNEMGADPGIDHMNAMRMVNQIRQKGGNIRSFRSYCGSLVAPESNDNPWGYKFTWSPMNVITAGQNGALFMNQGQLRCVPYNRLFCQTNSVEVPGLGKLDAYPNRDSLPYRKKYQVEDIPTFIRYTLRMPGYCRSWHNFVQLGLTDPSYRIEHSDRMTYAEWLTAYLPQLKGRSLETALAEFLEIPVDSDMMDNIRWTGMLSDKKIRLRNAKPSEILLDLLMEKWKFQESDIDMLIFLDRHIYTLENRTFEHTSWMVTKGIDHLETAISRCVGLPAAIAVKLILQGKIQKRGVAIPLDAEWYEPVLEELETFGICYENIEREIVPA
jgi:saccharopine dehydrogenase (NADP+, L-glutamate forming)